MSLRNKKFATINESTLPSKLKVYKYKYRRNTRARSFVDRHRVKYTPESLSRMRLRYYRNIKLRNINYYFEKRKSFVIRNTMNPAATSADRGDAYSSVTFVHSKKRLVLLTNFFFSTNVCDRFIVNFTIKNICENETFFLSNEKRSDDFCGE